MDHISTSAHRRQTKYISLWLFNKSQRYATSSYMSQYMYNNNEVRDIQQLDAINPWSPLSLYLSLFV